MHQIIVKELVNGVEIKETINDEVVVKLLSYNSKPFFRTTNEDDTESFQILDRLGEIYHLPSLATEFVLIDIEGTYYIPADGVELIAYSYKLKIFRPENEVDKVLALGEIDTTADLITVNVPEIGLPNSFLINGSVYDKYYKSEFGYTPVVEFQKILIVYAKPDAQIIHLAEGAESTEAVEPDYDGLFIARIIVDSAGEVVEETDNTFKIRSEDGWRTINNSSPAFISIGDNPAGSFHLTGTADVQGFVTKMGKFLWGGREFIIKTDHDVTLKNTSFTDTTNAKHWTFAEDYDVKAGWAILKEKDGFIEVAELGGGAEFPEGGNNGYVLEKDSAAEGGVKWSNSLQGEIDAEIVNRAAADNLLSNRITANETAITGKVDKPTTDGIWSLQKLGSVFTWVSGVVQNIANTDLSNISARIFTQANTFTWNTAGFNYFWKGLIDKSTDINHNRLLSINQVNGEIGFREMYKLKEGSFNPPTLAQLTQLGMLAGEFYKHTATGQISVFNGETLDNWYATVAEWNTLSVDQKNAVKNFNII